MYLYVQRRSSTVLLWIRIRMDMQLCISFYCNGMRMRIYSKVDKNYLQENKKMVEKWMLNHIESILWYQSNLCSTIHRIESFYGVTSGQGTSGFPHVDEIKNSPQATASVIVYMIFTNKSLWARICKRLRCPGINSNESMPPAPAYVAGRPVRQKGLSYWPCLGSLKKGIQIWALVTLLK